jgi:hypothetical protein
MAVGEARRSVSRAVICWRCYGRGHFRKDCPSPNASVARNQGKKGRRSAMKELAVVRAPESEQPRCGISPVRVAGFNPWVMLSIRNYCLPAILDSGSSFSFVRRDVFQQIQSLGLPCLVEVVNHTCHMASGQSSVIKEAVSLQIKLHSFLGSTHF